MESIYCSVIIPTWRRVAGLRETLESLSFQASSDFEVIVVSDGEDGGTRALSIDLKPGYALRWFFHSQNLGQAAARNTGAKAAFGAVLLFLDEDTSAHRDFVSAHLKHHRVDGARCITVYGKIEEERIVRGRSHTENFLQESWERTLEFRQSCMSMDGSVGVGHDFQRSVFCGLNCSIARDVFLNAGGFCELLRFMDEEMELGYRLYSSGMRFIYEPTARVCHRNTKQLSTYFRRCWALGGTYNVQRALELGQRNAQTAGLGSIHRGYLFNRMASRVFWYGSTAAKLLSAGLEKATDLTGSRLAFGAWARMCRPAEYWHAVKAEGCSLNRLKQVTGISTCALMFHSLTAPDRPEEDDYHLRPARFRLFLSQVRTSSYRWVTPTAWYKSADPDERLLLTFDDGYDDLYTELLPAVIELKLKPLVFLVADRMGATNVWDHSRGLRQRTLLTVTQVREMQRYGVEFGSHTLTHPWLPDTNDAELRREVHDSKLRLEDLLGTSVPAFAYPFGGVDQRVRAVVREAGYELAFTTNPGLNWWNDPLCLNRANVNDRDTRIDLKMKVKTGYSLRQWLGVRTKALEDDMPSGALRSAVGRVRALAKNVLYAHGRLR